MGGTAISSCTAALLCSSAAPLLLIFCSALLLRCSVFSSSAARLCRDEFAVQPCSTGGWRVRVGGGIFIFFMIRWWALALLSSFLLSNVLPIFSSLAKVQPTH
jgi:hypothetical protein